MTDIYELFEQAREGTLPNGFDQWDLADNDGRTVAHHAAWHGHLLVEFDRWGLANNVGWTVAHVAAWNGHLPAGFSNWDLADNEGWTVAHEAAFYGHLPEGFDQWGLKDNDGKTVEDVLRENHPELLQKHGLGAKERTIIGNDVFFYEVTPTASQYIKNQVKELFYGLQVTIDKLDGVETKPLPQWKVSLDKKYTCLALEKDGIVIGALKGKIERKAFHINSLVVRDDCRNKGYGMFLLGKAKGLMTKRGVKEWHLRAHCKNDIALRLYKKFGFETRSYNMAQKLT